MTQHRKTPGSVYERASGRWQAVAPEAFDPVERRRRRLSLGTYETEQEAWTALKRHALSGRPVDETAVSKMSIRRYLNDGIKQIEQEVVAGRLAQTTANGYIETARRHLIPALGNRRLGELNPRIINRWLVDLAASGLADRTVQRIYSVLHRAMADAGLPTNPSALPPRMRPKVRTSKTIHRPPFREIRLFLDHLDQCEEGRYWTTLYRVAAATGCRRGEICALEWDDIDLEVGTLRIRHAVALNGYAPFIKRPKSKASLRVVGLDGGTVDLLRRHRIAMVEAQVAAGERWEADPLDLNLVFRRLPHGGLLHPDLVSKKFKAEWACAGLADGPTLHSLRHSVGSALLREGLSVTEVAAHMGHDPDVLLKVYARDIDSTDRRRRTSEVTSMLLSEEAS